MFSCECLLKLFGPCLCDKIFPKTWQNDAVPLGASILAQFVLGMAWFGFIFAAPWVRALAIDKGVKDLKHIIHRYPMTLCMLGSIAANAVRTFAVYGLVVGLLKTPNAECGVWIQAGLFVFAVSCATSQHYLWSQRPFWLVAIEMAYEAASCVVGAGVLSHFLKAAAVAGTAGAATGAKAATGGASP